MAIEPLLPPRTFGYRPSDVRPPPLPSQIDVLRYVLDRVGELVEAGGPSPLVVFDLDGTLYDTRPRTLQILMDYADEIRPELPDVADSLIGLDSEGVRYLLIDTLRGRGILQNDVVRDINHYWHERFFSDDYLNCDVPNEGAADYVNDCHEAGATVVYLTGRDVTGMLLGTVASLRDHGFPFGVAGVELVCKPDAGLGDEAFKRMALPTLERCGQVVGFFDNEPANTNLARAVFPDAFVTLLETQRVEGAPEPEEGIFHVTDFRIG